MIAYFCRAYAMDLGIKLNKAAPNPTDSQGFLMELMTRLEADKKQIPAYQPEEAKVRMG